MTRRTNTMLATTSGVVLAAVGWAWAADLDEPEPGPPSQTPAVTNVAPPPATVPLDTLPAHQ